jgi:hypothetical protein
MSIVVRLPMDLKTHTQQFLQSVAELSPATPLWKRVPTRSDSGELLNDFMMLIPKLRQQPAAFVQNVIREIEAVLAYYHKYVVYADLNMKLNVLWVSIKPTPGLGLEMAAAIHHRVPEAKLVAHKPHYGR